MGTNLNVKVSGLKSVQVTLSSRLTKFEDKMNGQANPNVHAAQFLMYLSIQNQKVDSPSYGEMIWFGFPFFDNRTEWNNESSMFDTGTKSLMVGLGNKLLFNKNNNYFWKDGKINPNPNNPWASFSINIIDNIKKAYNTARAQGYFKSTSYEDLYISGMNIGWEIAGTYDAEVQIKDLNIITVKK